MEPPTLGRLTAYIDHDRVNISKRGACQQGSADEDRGELHGKLQAIIKGKKETKKDYGAKVAREANVLASSKSKIAPQV